MSDSSVGFHEPLELLSDEARELHRAITSLCEELEAVTWYRQRIDASGDELLRRILDHNMREEMEHASMLLEWLRRNNSEFEHWLKTYLFTDRDLLQIETSTEETVEETPPVVIPSEEEAEGQVPTAQPAPPRTTIGSLKELT